MPKQAEAGIDVGNDGEQQRDSFFLYLKERLTGLGGNWQRPSRADVDRYPGFKKRWMEQTSSKARVSPQRGFADGGRRRPLYRYGRHRGGVQRLRRRPQGSPDIFIEPFMNAPSPGIIAAAIKNQHYDTDLKYLQALGDALRIEYETIVRAGFVLQIDAPDLALERHISFKDKPLSVFLEFVENVVAVINVALEPSVRPRAPARLLGRFGIASRQRRAARAYSAAVQQAMSGPCICPSPAPATRTNFAASRNLP